MPQTADNHDPQMLPVLEYGREFCDLLEANRVVVVCGETGSGKTTQLPRIAFEAGFAGKGRRIVCTQPRRIAATSVAARVASEMGCEVGSTVGFRHRYEKKVSAETRIVFATDGILLAETRSDPLLRAYGVVMIDEAHERSLNIDFLLGILKRILEKRRDLKVVISSATMDAGAFSSFFGGAPVLSVPGRLFPVETRYMSGTDDDDGDLPGDVLKALCEVPPDSDTLVFLPGEREIRETSDRIAGSGLFPRDEIIPLMASLGAGETERAFRLSPRRRIILSTNVAETSLTVPGIRCVIDSGLARIPRYVHRTQVQRLQIERISRASARQRAGRSGRVAPGLCLRLYSEEDFNSREEWTPPEILRTSLAGVILSMLDLKLGSVETFPFLDPPKGAMIREGYRELLELGAVRRASRGGEIELTGTGKSLARIPLEPRFARMILAASDLAVLPRALPIVASMACEDPLRHPVDEREKANAAHAQFRTDGSDFLGILRLWRWWDGLCRDSSQSQLRKTAKKNYVSYRRMREWRELVRQLEKLSASMHLDLNSPDGGDDALHKALMSGLIGKIGKFDPQTKDYMGVHAVRFNLHPSSVFSKKGSDGRKTRPEWVMASELVDTSRLYARNVAAVDADWIEQVAGDVVKRHWYSPFWDAESGFVRVYEKTTLYSLVVADGRLRDFSRIDPAECRRIFILHALVNGEFRDPPAAVRRNAAILAEARQRAVWMRNPSLFDEDRAVAYFDRVVPEGIVSAGALRKWLARNPSASFALDRKEWLGDAGGGDPRFPQSIKIGKARIKLFYGPQTGGDEGMTAEVSKECAAALKLWRYDWLVPGALPEKVGYMLLSLPSSARRALPPADETLAIVLPMLDSSQGSLARQLAKAVSERFGLRLPAEVFESMQMPPRFSVCFRITDRDGRVIACSRNLDEALEAAGVAASAGGLAADGSLSGKFVKWDFGDLPPFSSPVRSASSVVHFKALCDEGDGVSVKLFKDRDAARVSHERGVLRLMQLAIAPKGGSAPFFAAAREAAIAGLPDILSAADFQTRLRERRGEISRLEREISTLEKDVMAEARKVSLESLPLAEEIRSDIATQVSWLTFPEFVKTVPYRSLKSYGRYFRAIGVRMSRARTNPSGDRGKMSRFAPYWNRYVETATGSGARIVDRAAFADYRWMLEEYRVSLFAQELGTAYPASPNRLDALWRAAVEI